jgi:hypothetical protein
MDICFYYSNSQIQYNLLFGEGVTAEIDHDVLRNIYHQTKYDIIPAPID